MKVLAVYSIKGGVGKTAAAVNLAYLSAKEGARTLIWDLDPQGAASFYLRIKPKVKGGLRGVVSGKRPLEAAVRGTDFDGLDLVPADFSYRKLDLALHRTNRPIERLAELLSPFAVDYDHVFLDCAPGITPAAESIFFAADTLIVPTMPTTLALRALDQLRRYLENKKIDGLRVDPFLSMVDRRKRLHRESCRESEASGAGFLATPIPYSSLVEQMGVHRAPIFGFAWSSEAARAYEALWSEIRARLEGGDAS